MLQENVEVVRAMNAAFNRGDLDAAFDYYESTAVWHSRADEPDTGDYHGLEAIRTMAGMWRGMFDDFRLELDEYVDAHDRWGVAPRHLAVRPGDDLGRLRWPW
jgi:ketosteroid isomerase-like protein